MPSQDYFAFFDTSNASEGQIIDDGELGFCSSWGKTNGSESDSKFVFNLQEKNFKNHLILLQENQWGKLSYENIEIKNIRPTRIGLLPIIKVIESLIGNAFWTTKKINFDNQFIIKKHLSNDFQSLILPEGAGKGQHWTNWFKSFVGVLISVIGLSIGIADLFFKLHPITKVISLVLTISGIVWTILENTILNKNSLSLIHKKIFSEIRDVKKIYNKLMENSQNFYNSPKINWKNLTNDYLPTYIDGELSGQAWLTSIFCKYSRMNLYTVWGVVNADIEYLVYN